MSGPNTDNLIAKNASGKKPSTRKSSTPGDNRKELFAGKRLQFLEECRKLYATKPKADRQAFARVVVKHYLKRFPWDLPDSQEPSDEVLAAVKDDEAEQEEPLPPEGTEAYADAMIVVGKRIAKENQLLDQIPRWLDYHSNKSSRARKSALVNGNEDTNGRGNRKGPSLTPASVMMARLTGVSSGKPPRRVPAHFFWARAQKDGKQKDGTPQVESPSTSLVPAPSADPSSLSTSITITPSTNPTGDTPSDSAIGDTSASSQTGSSGPMQKNLRLTNYQELAIQGFAALTKEEQATWEAISEADHKKRTADYQNILKGSPGTSPEERQQCIDNLSTFIKPILKLVSKHTGLVCGFWAGGPEPAKGGPPNILSAFHGSTPGPVSLDFLSAEREGWKTQMVPVIGHFIKSCYSKSECESRAIGENVNPSSSTNDDGDVKDDGDILHEDSVNGWVDEKTGKEKMGKESCDPSALLTTSVAVPRPLPAAKARAKRVPPVRAPRGSPDLGPPPRPSVTRPATLQDSSTASRAVDWNAPVDVGSVDLDDDEPPRNLPSIRSPRPLDTVSPPCTPVALPKPLPATANLSSPPMAVDATPCTPVPANGRSTGSSPSSSPPIPADSSPCTPVAPKPLSLGVDVSHPGTPSRSPGGGVSGAPTSSTPSSPSAAYSRSSVRTRSAARRVSVPSATQAQDRADDMDVVQSGGDDDKPGAGRKRKSVADVEGPSDEGPSEKKRRTELPTTNRVSTRAKTAATTTAGTKGKGGKAGKGGKSTKAWQPGVAKDPGVVRASMGQGEPAYVKNVLQMCTGVGGDSKWDRLIDAWLAVDAKAGFVGRLPEHVALASDGRPDDLGRWIGQHRSPKWRPECLDLATFMKEFIAWWRYLQPEEREDLEGESIRLSRVENADWSDLWYTGQNGIATVVAGLAWWRDEVNGLPAAKVRERKARERELARFDEALDDIIYAFETLSHL